MGIKLHIIKQYDFTVGLLGILVPWMFIIAFESSLQTLGTFIVVVAGMLAFGKFLHETIASNFTEEDKWLLSLPTGYLAVSGLTALAVRLGVSTVAVFWALATLMVSVSIRHFVRRHLIRIPKVQGFWALVPMSLIVALLYYLPGAIRDAVYLSDGSFNWMHVDTQYFHAIASSVKSSVGVPRLPGTSLVDLNYHFGSYSIAGTLSAVLGIPVGDSLVRVVRPIALISLILSTYAAGRFLGREAGREAAGGILAVVGLFFYGSIASFFANPAFSNLVAAGIFSEFPSLIPNNGGIFSHLFLGHSQVHGLSGLIVLVLVLLAKVQVDEKRSFTLDAAALGPAILFPSSILLGFASLGLYCAVLSWFGARHKGTWLTVAITISAAVFCASTMGYLGTLSSGQMVAFMPVQTAPKKLFTAFVWFHIGLGIRLYAFTRIRNPFRDPVSAILVILFSGFLATSLFIPNFDSRYGFLYAQGILGVFSFAWLAVPLHAALDGKWLEVFADFKRLLWVIVIASTAFLCCSALLHLLSSDKTASAEYVMSVSRTVKNSGRLVFLAGLGLIVFHKVKHAKAILAAAMACLSIFGFAAWIKDWQLYSTGRQTDITISKGEVDGLDALRKISERGDVVVTNKHAVPGFKTRPYRSYAYGALSERPVLVEGWEYSPIINTPLFKEILTDNELIFTSGDPTLVRQIVDKYGIRHIVAMPQTDIALANKLPEWLTKVSDSGTLKIYSITGN